MDRTPHPSSGQTGIGDSNPESVVRHPDGWVLYEIRTDGTGTWNTHPSSGEKKNSPPYPRCLHGAPEPDGTLKVVPREKILHYRQLYIDRPEPIAFMPVAVDTSGRIYHYFLCFLFLHVHRESSELPNDIPEESVNFVFFALFV